MFGVNFEDGYDMLRRNCDPGIQAQLAACKHSEWCAEYPNPAKEASAYKALSHVLSGEDLDAAWHLVCCLLHPDQRQRMTVQQALTAGFLQPS
ncbi:hypothetical protein ABBQ38_008728 [Trebouxia sp. C0009 RCD-2024]